MYRAAWGPPTIMGSPGFSRFTPENLAANRPVVDLVKRFAEKKGATPALRKSLEEQTGIGHDLLLEWINHVDLYRIKGIGSEYSDLLEEAGVDSVPELAQRKPENLVTAMTETNKKKKIVRKLPTEKQVKDWVDQAKKLSRVIKY